ncbi:hypothetical protein G6F65_021858 [Rhizopus arrhizus]|nr:hypothetical protein G6F65_021858 [Rhizopus arrhizus]
MTRCLPGPRLARRRRASSRVRSTCTPALSTPGSAGTSGLPPMQRISLSYPSAPPSDVSTWRSRSRRRVADTLGWNSMSSWASRWAENSSVLSGGACPPSTALLKGGRS